MIFGDYPQVEVMTYLTPDHHDTTADIYAAIDKNLDSIDPVDGDVLGRLNNSEVGEVVPCGDVYDSISSLLAYTDECYGAYDPTLQILWDVYDFENGGRYVSDYELADALQWVGYNEVEIEENGILRKGENVRFGFGPVITGAIVDWAVGNMTESGIEDYAVSCGHCATIHGDVEGRRWDAFSLQQIQYPLDKLTDDAYQQPIGTIRLQPDEYIAAIDDDEKYFFAHGDQYHQVIDPIMGVPTRNVLMVVVVSDESCLQASVFAYAVMVMGVERGLEFLDDTDGVEGLIYSEPGEVHVSGGLGDRFWR